MACVLPLAADPVLPPILASGMVLQQRAEVRLWGRAEAGEALTVRAGWTRSVVRIRADADGAWEARLRTPGAGGPFNIRIQGRKEVRLDDVLIGEVWLCSGQSNMEFTLRMLGGWTAFPQERKQPADWGRLRLCTIGRRTSATPEENCEAKWVRSTPETVEDFSATAYFFARELQRRLKAPIGLVCSAWGGTEAEAWTPRAALEADPELVSTLEDPGGEQPNRPAHLYNGMIHPLRKLRIRGAIWYQGESNCRNADLYPRLFPALIGAWRKAWGIGDFPFYFVQIAPFAYTDELPTSAFVRDAQRRSLKVPNTGMAVTLDIGDPTNIHPKDKPELGRRLALWALANTYGRKVGPCSGPLLREVAAEGHRLRIRFDHAEGGLKPGKAGLAGFEVAAKDGAFRPAQARIEGRDLVLWSPEVAAPAEARYLFSHAQEASLFNGAGLPAATFRSDDRPLLLRSVRAEARWDPAAGAGEVRLACADPACEIRYRLGGGDPGPEDSKAAGPIPFVGDLHLRARAFKAGGASPWIQDLVFRRHGALARPVRLSVPPSPRYPGRPGGLTDGVLGSTDLHDGRWMGFEGEDLEAVLDLGAPCRLASVAMAVLHAREDWVFPPRSVAVDFSLDGNAFGESVPMAGPVPGKEPAVVELQAQVGGREARFIRFRVLGQGLCPPGHEGAGQKAWFFLSELSAVLQAP